MITFYCLLLFWVVTVVTVVLSSAYAELRKLSSYGVLKRELKAGDNGNYGIERKCKRGTSCIYHRLWLCTQ